MLSVNQVCPRYYPFIGGVETVVQETSERLLLAGTRTEVFTLNLERNLPAKETINGVPINRLNVFFGGESYCLSDPKLLLDLTRDADLVHAYNIHTLLPATNYLSCKLRGNVPFVFSPYYHGTGKTPLARLLWFPYQRLAKKIIEKADAIIVNAFVEQALIHKAFGQNIKTYVVYDGASVPEIKKAQPLLIDSNKKIILYVGRLDKYKNIQIAIKAMRYLPNNFHFYIIGRGPYKSELERLVSTLSLNSQVHFLGFQTNDAVRSWLKTAHAFVHLSSVESFGMTCIESLAAGTPVVANDDGLGLTETISLYPESILKFKATIESPKRLSELLIQCINMKPIRADVSRFSWNVIVQEISQIYKQVLYC